MVASFFQMGAFVFPAPHRRVLLSISVLTFLFMLSQVPLWSCYTLCPSLLLHNLDHSFSVKWFPPSSDAQYLDSSLSPVQLDIVSTSLLSTTMEVPSSGLLVLWRPR